VPRLTARFGRAGALALVPAALAVASPAYADPTPRECATASEEELTLRKQEKLADAKNRLLTCSAPSCPAEVRDECARRMAELTAAQPTVVFDVKDAAGADLSAVRVSVDGAPLLDHLGTGAVTIDPGEHVFRFEASGQLVEKKLVVRESEKGRLIEASFGGVAPAAGEPAAATAPPAPAPDAGAATSSSWSTQKTIALVVAGVGVVGVGVGSYFGVQAFSNWSQAKNDCNSSGSCGAGTTADAEKGSAQSAATASTIAFAVGGAAIVGAGILWFTAPSGAVQVAPTVGGFALRGRF
jgi:hypothetical protein